MPMLNIKTCLKNYKYDCFLKLWNPNCCKIHYWSKKKTKLLTLQLEAMNFFAGTIVYNHICSIIR